MINFTPINKRIRRTLARRSEALVRDNVTDPLAPVSDDLISTTSRSIWVKMFSPTQIKTKGKLVEGARIFGGEVFRDGGDFPILFGYGQTYGRVEAQDLEPQSDGRAVGPQKPLKRPIPGITSFTCNYSGGISATREAEINFIIWSLEDLERLTPHFFAHGRGVLLEWGYGSLNTSSTETITDSEMIDGAAYNKINRLVLDSGGIYDGMAGVITSYNYSLRGDGGFDCTLKIISRGVNVFNEQLDNSDQIFKSNSGDDSSQTEVEAWPTLDEFLGILEEELLSLSYQDSSWFTSVESVVLSNKGDTSWDTSKQPPGVFVYQDDNTLSFEKTAGPYVSWGWLEDNVLSKWVGRFDKNKKVVNQFRSIEPVIDNETGDFIDENGELTTDIEKAKFESVKISNHKYLVTPHMDRWILPGQFPADQNIDEEGNAIWDALLNTPVIGGVVAGVKLVGGLIDKFHTSGEEFRNTIAKVINDGGHFEHFAVPGDEGKGYLRNILLSTNLIRDSFNEAKTLKEGMQALFDSINQDVDSFWSFTMVNDSYLDGNTKVVDTKCTHLSPKDLLLIEKPKGNPDSALYVFDSWGEKSIVKTQEMTVELPSAFAVTAMYAGTSKKGAEESAGATDEQVMAKLTSADGEDPSQPEVVKPSRIEGRFGSENPYLLEGAGAKPSSDNKYFGPGKGIPFKNIDYVQLLLLMDERLKDQQDAKKKVEERTEEKAGDSVSRTNEAINNFVNAFRGKALYDDKGNLGDSVRDKIIHKKVMNNILKGQVSIVEDTIIELEDIEDDDSATDLFPVELSIEIDGVGGIFPGNCFHVNYIQQRFQEFCVFQVFGVEQTVGTDSWTTSLTGKLRVASGLFKKQIAHISKINPTTDSSDGEPSSEEKSLDTTPLDLKPINADAATFNSTETDNTSTATPKVTETTETFTASNVRTTKAQLTEIKTSGPNNYWSAVAYSYDVNKPNIKVKGESKVEFLKGATSEDVRARKRAAERAETKSKINYARAYGNKQ